MTTKPTYEELTATYNALVREKEQYRTALEKIRWLEGVNPRAYKIALGALKAADSNQALTRPMSSGE
jgi:hypothetical protein